MELLQLKYFCDAAASENFSKTAQKFEVPPSNISQSIRRLEKELGTSLFVRHANSIVLNENGKKFYERISKALSMISDAVNETSDDGNRGKLSICINTNRRVVMNTVEKFQRVYPSVNIKTKFFIDPESEEFDLIVANDDIRLLGYDRQLLLCEQIGIAMKRNNSEKGNAAFNVADLKNEPFITMNDDSSLFNLTHSVCKNYGFVPNIAVQSDDPYYVRKCVELGLGVAVVPMFSWKGQFHEDVVLVPVDGVVRESFLYTSKERYLPLCARHFADLLVKECIEENSTI